MYLLELKATFLYRLFNWGKITTFKIDEEPLIHIQGVKYIENINIENISNIKIESGLFFSSLIIITNDNIIRKIPYIYRSKTDKIVQLLPVIKAFSKVKNINLKILNKFNGQEYVSYRDNLIFYKNVITKNKQFLDYKEDFEIMFSKFDFSKTFENLYKYLGNKEKIRLENNERFMQVEPSRSEKFLKGLNERQALSVIINEDNVMVVAGAGAGKTKVIETKVNYLVNKLQVDPSSILVLAFNKDAVLELQNRINCIPSVNIKTFHSLGNKILGKDVDKRLIDFVASEDKYNAFIKGLILKTLSNKPFYNLLFLYFQSFFYNIKNPYNFGSKGEYDTYIKENKLISLKGDNVKSFGEIDIANFLYLHGIPYQYEAEYKGEYERKFEYGTYHPDFYIPANENHKDIYIEFFGIDRNGKTPSYINEKKYNESINWKRGVHQKNKTELIDLYAYNKFEGNLLRELKRKLTKLNVDCHKMLPPEERFKVLNDTEGIDKFTKLMTKFLTN